MSIFRRENETQSEPDQPARPARSAPRPPTQQKKAASESTYIATGSRVVGQISGAADLVIDGVVDGEIDLESRVIVGAEGRVEGKVLARSVEVGGKVLGNVQGVERVEVLATGSLEGDVLSPRVVIAEGAFFKGKVEMTDKLSRRAPAPKSPPAEPARGEKPPLRPGQAAGGQQPAGQQTPGKLDAGRPPEAGQAKPAAASTPER